MFHVRREPHAVTRLGGAEPTRRSVPAGHSRPAGQEAEVGHQGQGREVGGARPADLRLLRADGGHPGDEVRPLLEGLVDHPLHRVFQGGRRRQRRDIGDLDRCRGRQADAVRQLHLGVALPSEHVLEVERRLRFLLPGERDLGQVARPFCSRLSAASRTDRAESTALWATAILRVEAGEGEEGPLDVEDDLLVRAVEAEVGGEQALLGRVHRAPSTPKSRSSQRRFSVGHGPAPGPARKKPLGATSLGAGNA